MSRAAIAPEFRKYLWAFTGVNSRNPALIALLRMPSVKKFWGGRTLLMLSHLFAEWQSKGAMILRFSVG